MLCLVIAVTSGAFLILHEFPASNVSLLFALETCSLLSVFCDKKSSLQGRISKGKGEGIALKNDNQSA